MGKGSTVKRTKSAAPSAGARLVKQLREAFYECDEGPHRDGSRWHLTIPEDELKELAYKIAAAIEKAEADRERVISRHGGSIVTLGAYTDALAVIEGKARTIRALATELRDYRDALARLEKAEELFAAASHALTFMDESTEPGRNTLAALQDALREFEDKAGLKGVELK